MQRHVVVRLVGGLLGLGTLGAAAAVAPASPAAAQVAAPARLGLEPMAMEAGVWDADLTFPSNDPAKPDSKAKGVQVNRLRSGGMWIINEFSVDGTPYEGTGVWGFDRSTGRYSGIWVDNNDQTIRFDDGRWDPATQTMTWTANSADPQGRYTRFLVTEKFQGNVRRFDSVALTRKGEVPLVRILFTKRAEAAAAKR
jgi:hypothetical protein